MIYTVGIVITFFLFFILLTKKEKSNADIVLAIWLFITGLHLSFFYLIISGKYLQLPFLLGLEIPIPLLHGPFLYIYTTSLTNPKSVTRNILFHFTPYLIGFIAIVPFISLSSSEKLSVYFHNGKEYSILILVFFMSIIISGITYSLLSLRSLIRYHKSILEVYSYTEKISLRWLYFLILGLSIIWIVVIIADDQYIFSAVVLYVLLIGYFGIKQVGIFTNQFINIETISTEFIEIENKTIQPEKVKYEKNELMSHQLKEIHEALTLLMKDENLYQTPEINLSDVAKKLNIHSNSLSQVINRLENKNFFDYINGLRIDEFKKRINQPENQKFTMLSVAYDCGFNSKTSFNRNFKKATGISPTQYLKKVNINLNE